MIAGQTLAPGTVATVSGTVVSLASNGASTVVGSSVQTLQALVTPSAAALTIGTSRVAPNEQGAYVVAGQTLSPGSAATVSGTVVSLASNGASAIIGSSVQILQSSAAAVAPSITAAGIVSTVSISRGASGVSFVPAPASPLPGAAASSAMTAGASAIGSSMIAVAMAGLAFLFFDLMW